MAAFFSVRSWFGVVCASALFAFAFTAGSFAQFISTTPTARAGDVTPGFTVNHFRKGDRLPLVNSSTSSVPGDAVSEEHHAPALLESTERMPLGCDPAFSPVASPSRFIVYGRCSV